jgi:hypothetical protein
LITVAERRAVVDAVEEWSRIAAGLRDDLHAAGLLAIDLILTDRARLWDDHPTLRPLRARLEAAGAAFNFSPLGGAHVYTRSFLREAVATGVTERAGELAFLALAQLGFETSGTCRDQGGLGFRTVIMNGEAFLRANPDASIRTEIHFLLARAYSDIVALAGGAGYHLTDEATSQYIREAAGARTRAIDEYRAGFNAPTASRFARASWPDAWRLMAGLQPSRTYFYCIYD